MDVQSVSTATTVLGTQIALPVLIAPLALQRMAHPDGELATARAAAAAGTIMCLSSAATCSPAEVAAAASGGLARAVVSLTIWGGATATIVGGAVFFELL